MSSAINKQQCNAVNSGPADLRFIYIRAKAKATSLQVGSENLI